MIDCKSGLGLIHSTQLTYAAVLCSSFSTSLQLSWCLSSASSLSRACLSGLPHDTCLACRRRSIHQQRRRSSYSKHRDKPANLLLAARPALLQELQAHAAFAGRLEHTAFSKIMTCASEELVSRSVRVIGTEDAATCKK